jgi:dCTP deaminase
MGDGNSGLGGILSDSAIRKAVEYGDIEIDPFDPERLNPCSYDLALGNEIVSYQSGAGAPVPYLDARVRPGTYSFKFDDGMVLHPNVGYLMHTVERVATKKYVPVLDGKSSLGRLFMKIHETAGYGDPGFDGQYTLEVTVMYPLRIYPGMRIAQMRFHTIMGDVERLYDGNYKGETSRGPVASRAWKQFITPPVHGIEYEPRKCPDPSKRCLACDRNGYHMEPVCPTCWLPEDGTSVAVFQPCEDGKPHLVTCPIAVRAERWQTICHDQGKPFTPAGAKNLIVP